ncbi:hypothetical protein FCM49_02580 [Mycoplasma bovis]|uniref:Uncharacterized protein n=1 Tax=Mycoplasmopsis bovis TaxID=28903 RepID=A0A2N8U2F4_MYCBV|nr:hypothetical protein CH328_02415 [Mycoplasmopsis bovis]MBT1315723.1 hypothetical protein [Mycoplasmopsis bovis]MBT1317190.1 hypothetical protein [Mycoplasmopsis bovis]MBT1322412.1 hypothetical protein [Mycoplasmopsis bovis]MBT1324552.1 hypothetical protein [Mycoplasmopsis bovis]
MISNFEKLVRKLTFEQLKNEISKFIEQYNKEGFLKEFKWKTPQLLWDAYIENKLEYRAQ